MAPVSLPPYFRLLHHFYALLPQLREAAVKVYLCVTRHTLGWHRESAPLAASLIARETGLAESSVRRAVRELQARGLIEVEGDANGGRLSHVYRLVLDSEDAPSPPTVNGLPAHHAPHVKKNSQRNLEKKHHQPARPAAPPRAATPPPTPAPSPTPPTTPDDASSRSMPKKTKINPEQKEALGQLLALGVSEGMARRLVGTQPLAVIRQTLEHLPFRQVKDPAAWAVQEILDGGYAPPAELAAKKKRDELQARRQAERQAEEERREREDQEFRQRVQTLLGGLSPAEKERLLAMARQRVGSWAHRVPGLLEEDSPVMRAILLDLVQERANALPPPSGDSLPVDSKSGQDGQNHTEPSRSPLNEFKFAGRGLGHPGPRKWPEGALEARRAQPMVSSAFA